VPPYLTPQPHHPVSVLSTVRRPPGSTPFPYTTLFRSQLLVRIDDRIYEQKLQQAKATLAAQKAALANSEQTRRSNEARIKSSERSEEHTSELQSRENLVCRLLLEKKNNQPHIRHSSAP